VKSHRDSAELMRALLAKGRATPTAFRNALTDVPPTERDAWCDRVLGIEGLPEDGLDLPRGCVPYIPCSVDALLRMVDDAGVQPDDVFVDIGSGIGRAAALTHFLTGATAIGLEIQAALVRTFRDLTKNWHAPRISVVHGDAADLTGFIGIGSVFFLYCPFSGDRLERVLLELEFIARTRRIRVCCVDMPSIARSWLTPAAPPSNGVTVYESTR
jgi:SAM-dependent methyltransferase